MIKSNLNKTLYLHIGIWKTATTTIQNTLFSNRNELKKIGLLYPSNFANHSFLASAFHQNPDEFIVAKTVQMFGEQINNWHKTNLSLFETEITQYPKVLVSSEFLLDLSKNKIDELKAYLSNLFSSIKVVVYLRSPVEHLSSAINEQIKQGHYNLENAYKIHAQAKEYAKVENWINVFGKENIVMRPFEREQFLNNDIVDDFLGLLFQNMPIPKIQRLLKDQNTSISFPAILLADSVIAKKGSQNNETPRRYLFEIRGIPYQAPIAVKDQVNQNSCYYIEKYRKEFGLKFLKEQNVFKESPSSDQIWSAETIESIATVLDKNELMIMNLQSDNYRLNGLLKLSSGDKDEAESFFKRAVKSGWHFESHRDYAVFLKDERRYKEALDICNKAISLKPDRPWPKTLKKEIRRLWDNSSS